MESYNFFVGNPLFVRLNEDKCHFYCIYKYKVRSYSMRGKIMNTIHCNKLEDPEVFQPIKNRVYIKSHKSIFVLDMDTDTINYLFDIADETKYDTTSLYFMEPLNVVILFKANDNINIYDSKQLIYKFKNTNLFAASHRCFFTVQYLNGAYYLIKNNIKGRYKRVKIHETYGLSISTIASRLLLYHPLKRCSTMYDFNLRKLESYNGDCDLFENILATSVDPGILNFDHIKKVYEIIDHNTNESIAKIVDPYRFCKNKNTLVAYNGPFGECNLTLQICDISRKKLYTLETSDNFTFDYPVISEKYMIAYELADGIRITNISAAFPIRQMTTLLLGKNSEKTPVSRFMNSEIYDYHLVGEIFDFIN